MSDGLIAPATEPAFRQQCADCCVPDTQGVAPKGCRIWICDRCRAEHCDRAAIYDAWPNLAPPLRAAILAMIRAAMNSA